MYTEFNKLVLDKFTLKNHNASLEDLEQFIGLKLTSVNLTSSLKI